MDRITVMDWFDIFIFDSATTITCPDCDQISPELPDVWAAAQWTDKHQKECA